MDTQHSCSKRFLYTISTMYVVHALYKDAERSRFPKYFPCSHFPTAMSLCGGIYCIILNVFYITRHRNLYSKLPLQILKSIASKLIKMFGIVCMHDCNCVGVL